MLHLIFIALVASALLIGRADAGEKVPVDLLLVLAADVSTSVDDEEFKKQREGYIQAFCNERVIRAITSGPLGRIAVTYIEWSAEDQQKVIVDWTLVDGRRAGSSFAGKIAESARPGGGWTAIGNAIRFATQRISGAPFEAIRRVIDVSGDGTSNQGVEVSKARDEALANDITINGLVILSREVSLYFPEHTHPPGGLQQYYYQNVAGGPGAFVEVAEGFESFADAILNKLIKEIASDGTGPPRS